MEEKDVKDPPAGGKREGSSRVCKIRGGYVRFGREQARPTYLTKKKKKARVRDRCRVFNAGAT